jgi:hypothetical protein
VLIYENDCFVPFGVVYSEWISEDRMRELPPAVRDIEAFAAATIPIQTAVVLQDVSEISDEKISSIEKGDLLTKSIFSRKSNVSFGLTPY